MRKLASVRQISNILPIPNADRLELALIDGWQAVVKKGEYKAGDRIIYCEIDSFLPIKEEYEFLRASCYRRMAEGKEGFRIKTMKLRGQLSQGLVLPLYDSNLRLGEDVTEALGIIKYEPESLSTEAKGAFPGFIPRTDEERIQNLASQLPNLRDRKWMVTEKLDGTSFTCYHYEGEFGVCSRNNELLDLPSSLHWQIAKKYALEEKLKGLYIAIQGEVVGEKIQGNKYQLDGRELYVFNIYLISAQSYIPQKRAKAIVEDWGLKFVPTIELNYRLPEAVEEILELAEGRSALNPAVRREGLVLVSDEGSRVSFKSISNGYLLSDKS